jgi:hypothetical protein
MTARLPAEDLAPAAFAPFGRVIERPGWPEDVSGPGWRWWAETAAARTQVLCLVLEHTGRDDVTFVCFPGQPVTIEG